VRDHRRRAIDIALRSAIARAEEYGFNYRGPVRLFIEMTFLRGSAFDTDPQYVGAGEIMRASGDQMQRARELHDGCLDYLVAVSGPEAVNERKALNDLLIFARKPAGLSGDFEGSSEGRAGLCGLPTRRRHGTDCALLPRSWRVASGRASKFSRCG
jgi:hypothetical protein